MRKRTAAALAAMLLSALGHGPAHAPDLPADEQAGSAFRLSAAYTAEVWRNEGGVKDGWRYLDNLDVVLEADLERAAGWKGATGQVYVLYNNGASLSELTGDIHIVSNIETGVRALRLYEAWIEQEIGDTASVKVGLYDLNSEFDALETSALFIGSAHGIGQDIAQTGENGPSIFPVTSLSVRAQVQIDDGLLVRAAILDAVPGDLDRPSRTAIALGDGVLAIAEADWRMGALRLLAGGWRYSEKQDRVDGRGEASSSGAYLRGETCLRGAEYCGIAVFARAGIASGATNPYAAFLSGGVVFSPREEEQVGLAVVHAIASDVPAVDEGRANSETVIEATYARLLTSWLSVQPDVQYVINPGASPGTRDALVMGLRVAVGF
ncbi:carbohydrate porin [uncultured Croceicoccus sp.]|uniref:carbohydrate porin n=1 Tax=uncultured Croceicoccus sp. TaxID=1295329 RepID=UPI0026059727|nr:carbohydrate porin [uncultured Croceicoccus sp.]